MSDKDLTITWKEVVESALQELGGEAKLPEIYKKIQDNQKTRTNPTWNATVRRTLQQYTVFQPKGKGLWALKEIPARVLPVEMQPNIVDVQLDHASAQGMLLNLGKLHRFETYAPPTDATARQFNNAPLSEFVTVRNLPLFASPSRLKDFKNVDVIWLTGKGDNLVPIYAFEVEHTRDLKAALLRLYQFVASNLMTQLFIVAPSEKAVKFETEIIKPPFEDVRERFAFRSYTDLVPFYNSAVRYEEKRQAFL